MRSTEEIKNKEKFERINLSNPNKNMLVRKYLETNIMGSWTIMKEHNPVCELCGDDNRGNKYQYDNKILCSPCIENLGD